MKNIAFYDLWYL